MKRPKIDDYKAKTFSSKDWTFMTAYREALEQYCDELEKKLQKEGLINLTNAEDYHATRQENEDLRKFISEYGLKSTWDKEQTLKQK